MGCECERVGLGLGRREKGVKEKEDDIELK